MTFVLPSIPYPLARNDGYWAPITSTLDWCEENYYATRYSAEIVNSLTNLLFIYLAYRGISNCLQQNHERIFLLTFVGYLIVGSGSFAFHTTLKYPMQLVDELSMIYTTCLMFWATFEHKREQTFRTLLGFALAGLAIFITAYYHYLQDPTFHQNAYAILTAIVLLRSMYIMEVSIRPFYRERREKRQLESKGQESLSPADKAEQERRDNRDREILPRLLKSRCLYVGALGPKKRTEKILAETGESWTENLYAPVGLDIGANTPEAIALSIVAEIQAVLSNRRAGFLRDRQASIYGRS